jgi:tetratricopeptide (TPR) repeat protein
MRIFGETRWVFVGVFFAVLTGVGAYYYHNQDEIKNVPSGPEIAQLFQNTVASAEVAFTKVKTKVMEIIDEAKEPQVVSVDPRINKPSAEPAEIEPEPENRTEAPSSASSQAEISEQAQPEQSQPEQSQAEQAPVVEVAKKAETPELPKDDFSRAVELNKLRRFEKAIQFLEKSKDKTATDLLKKEYFIAFTGLGTKLRKKGDCETAIGYFKKAFSTNLADPSSPLNLAGCYIALKRSEEAELMIREALNLSDDKSKVYFSLGQSYSDASLPEKAMEAYDKALEMDPNHWEYVYGRGHELFVQGKIDESIKLLKVAEKMAPKPGNVYWSLSMAYCKKKNGKKALAYYLKLLKTKHPKINVVANYLGKHCANNDEEPLAMNTME